MGSKVSARKSAALTAVGLLIFILYLYVFAGFDEVLNVLVQVDPVEYALYYSLTFAAIMLSTLFYSMTWHELLKTLSIDTGLWKAFMYCILANFIDLVIPLEAVTGELTRVYLLHRDSGDRFGSAVASVVSHRIISNFFALGALIISAVSLIRHERNPYVSFLLAIVILGTAASIIILFYLSVREEAAERLIEALMRLAGFFTGNRLVKTDLREKTKQNLLLFHQGFNILGKHTKQLAISLVYTSVSWFFHLIIYFLVFYALGYTKASFFVPQMIIVFSISLAAQMIPVGLPVGLVEIVMASLYSFFGIPPALGGTATTMIRVVTFWFQILIGYLVAQWIGIKILSNLRNSESE